MEYENKSLFKFSDENLVKISEIIKKYPDKRQKSAIMPVLDIAQRQNDGWLSEDAMNEVGKILSLPSVYVKEIATFYSMFCLEPTGKYVIEVCSTLSCMLCGSKDLISALESYLNISIGQITDDGLFSLKKIECLGSCISAPVVKIGDYYYEDLDPESIINIIDSLKNNKEIHYGSQKGRKSSAPVEI